MKKIIYTVVLSLASFSFLSAQTIEIRETGQSMNLSGQVIQIMNTTGLEDTVDLEVFNMTGTSQVWKITRDRIDVPANGWSDFLCWGATAASGLCYTYKAQNPWTTNSPATIYNNEHGSLIIHIDPSDLVNGSGHYRYYVGTDTDLYMDSVDVLITTSTLAVKENKQAAVFSVSPNPADHQLSISSVGEGSVKVTDVLGKVILEERMNMNKKLDVSSFKNGVYFVTLTANGSSTSKRFVVKH